MSEVSIQEILSECKNDLEKEKKIYIGKARKAQTGKGLGICIGKLQEIKIKTEFLEEISSKIIDKIGGNRNGNAE